MISFDICDTGKLSLPYILKMYLHRKIKTQTEAITVIDMEFRGGRKVITKLHDPIIKSMYLSSTLQGAVLQD